MNAQTHRYAPHSNLEKETLIAMYKVLSFVKENDNYAITGFTSQLQNAIYDLEDGKRTPAKPVRKPSHGSRWVG